MFLVTGIGTAQDMEYSGDPDASYFNARDLAFAGKSAPARDTLQRILTKYPEYTDVRNLLAKTYSWDHQYDAARLEFNRVTSTERMNIEAWTGAIRNEIYAKKYPIALGLCNKALLYLPENKELQQLKQDVMLKMEEESSLQNRLKMTKMEEPQKQAITLYSSGEVFQGELNPMYYGALEYKRNAKWGILLPRLNYNRRFDHNGVQAEIDAYPRFSKTMSGYLNYGYSDALIFPKHRFGAEVLKELPKSMEVSLGFRQMIFEEDRATVLTGSFGLYRGNYYMALRPFVVPDADKGAGVSGNMVIRKYLRDGNHFLGLSLAYGFDTELNQFVVNGQLLAETSLYLESQRLRFDYQFTNSEGNNQYRIHLGINRQEFAFSSGNFYISALAGIAYQVKFR